MEKSTAKDWGPLTRSPRWAVETLQDIDLVVPVICHRFASETIHSCGSTLNGSQPIKASIIAMMSLMTKSIQQIPFSILEGLVEMIGALEVK